MVNVGKYTIHGSYGIQELLVTECLVIGWDTLRFLNGDIFVPFSIGLNKRLNRFESLKLGGPEITCFSKESAKWFGANRYQAVNLTSM